MFTRKCSKQQTGIHNSNFLQYWGTPITYTLPCASFNTQRHRYPVNLNTVLRVVKDLTPCYNDFDIPEIPKPVILPLVMVRLTEVGDKSVSRISKLRLVLRPWRGLRYVGKNMFHITVVVSLCVSVCVFLSVCLCVCWCVYVCVGVCMCVCWCVYVCVSVCVSVVVCLCVLVHTYWTNCCACVVMVTMRVNMKTRL